MACWICKPKQSRSRDQLIVCGADLDINERYEFYVNHVLCSRIFLNRSCGKLKSLGVRESKKKVKMKKFILFLQIYLASISIVLFFIFIFKFRKFF